MDQRGLVERAMGGDHDSFAALARGSVARLDAVARLILRDADLARDAVQEALVRAWRDLPGLRDPSNFDAWLHRLTVNASIDAVRRRRRRVIEVELTPIHDPTIPDETIRVADRDQLARARQTRLGGGLRPTVIRRPSTRSRRSMRTAELWAPVDLKMATMALSRGSSGERPAQPRSRATQSSSPAPLVGVIALRAAHVCRDILLAVGGRGSGAGDGTRTRDILLGKQTLYRLSYSRPEVAQAPWLSDADVTTGLMTVLCRTRQAPGE